MWATLFLGLLTFSSALANASSDADNLLGSDRVQIFESFVHQIADFETVSQKGLSRMNTTWQKELERTKQGFIDAKTREDVYYATSAFD